MGSDACFSPAGFAVGWGPIPWLLMSEIFPLHVKGIATGVCVLTNWLMAFLVTKEFSSLMVSTSPEGQQRALFGITLIAETQDQWPCVGGGPTNLGHCSPWSGSRRDRPRWVRHPGCDHLVAFRLPGWKYSRAGLPHWVLGTQPGK